jgi:hypothetical protein
MKKYWKISHNNILVEEEGLLSHSPKQRKMSIAAPRLRPHRQRSIAVVSACACCLYLSSSPRRVSVVAGFSSPPIFGGTATSSSSSSSSSSSRCLATRLRSNDDDATTSGDDDYDLDEWLDEDGDGNPKHDPDVTDQIRRAKRLLEDARRKQKAREEKSAAASAGADDVPGTTTLTSTSTTKRLLPFFAAATTAVSSADDDAKRKIKSTTSTGSIIADGETMAAISKSERWERRSLSEMFEKEARNDFDGLPVAGEQIDKVGTVLADRDVARSIWNLRRSMQNEDFMKVFDSRNRFIGDLD